MAIKDGWFVDRAAKLYGLGSGYVPPPSEDVVVVVEYSPSLYIFLDGVDPFHEYDGYWSGSYDIDESIPPEDYAARDYYQPQPSDLGTYPDGYIMASDTFIVALTTPLPYTGFPVSGPHWDTTLGRVGHPSQTDPDGTLWEINQADAHAQVQLDIDALDTIVAVTDLTTHGAIGDFTGDDSYVVYTQVNKYVTDTTMTVLVNMNNVTQARIYQPDFFMPDPYTPALSVHLRAYAGGTFSVDDTQTVVNTGGTLLWQETITMDGDAAEIVEIGTFTAAGVD